MMAMFFAQRVILGKAFFSANFGEQGYIPPTLRGPVAEVLLESGLNDLVPAEYGGTAP